MSGDDERDRDERPKLSWREIDRRRDGSRSRSERRPRGRAAEARAQAATQSYLKQLDDKLFAKDRRGAEAERLARAVEDALGTSGLTEACRAYLAQAGPPETPALLGAFLDAHDGEVVLAGLRVLAEALPAGRIAPTAGLRAQLEGLSESPDDAVAELAEEVLERL